LAELTAVRRRPAPARLRAPALVGIASAGVAVAATTSLEHPILLRPLLALFLAALLAVTAWQKPDLGIVLALAFLVVMGLLRRLLIPAAGWTSYDPLLLVIPVVAVVVFIRLQRQHRRPLLDDGLSRLVLALLLLTLLESVNPLSGSLVANLAGLLFLAAPLVWFFIGRQIMDRRLVTLVLGSAIVLGVCNAAYGMVQAVGAMPSWDVAWLQTGGYTALRVGNDLKPFGTFTSSAEYAAYLAVALVLAVALAINGRRLALTVLPILAVGLFLDSTRGVVALAVLAVIVMFALRMRRASGALAIGALAVAVAGATVLLLGPTIEQLAIDSGSPLVVHETAGLLHPFDPNQSTLGLHLQRIGDGLGKALANPLGLGTGASNLAGAKLGATVTGTEVDVSNAFVNLGLIGGALFVAVVVTGLGRLVAGYRRTPDPYLAGVLGLAIVTLGQWLGSGGQYAVAPLLWLALGWATRARSRVQAEWS
jgi:hypothetical protein